MNDINSMVVIEQGAQIGENVKIGPFSYIGKEVIIEDGVTIHENVVIKGKTKIEEGTEIYPFASIGLPPQDLKYDGEKSEVIVGKNCRIREHVTIHAGTSTGIMKTVVGDNCLLMVGTHIAHDCIVGTNVVMANNATLAGHVIVGDYSIIGGLSAILQHVRIGKYAMIGGMTGVTNDVTPYAMIFGNRGVLCGLNLIGLKRRGFSRDEIREINLLYQLLFYKKDLTFKNRLDLAREQVISAHGQIIIDFLLEDSKKNICHPTEQ